MHKKKILLATVCSALLVCLLLVGVRLYTDYRIGYKSVYVASHRLKQRNIITEEDLEEIRVPGDYLSNDVYTDEKDIIGKCVRIDAFIPKGSLFYRDFLEDSEDIKDKAHTLLENNEVSYDLFVSDVNVNTANIIQGMNIDIYLTIDSHETIESDLLFRNVRIIGLYDSNDREINDYDKDSRANIITLALVPEYVPILNKAIVLGELKIVVGSDTYSRENKIELNSDSEILKFL